MRRIAWTFAARIGDKYQIRLTRPKPYSLPAETNVISWWQCDFLELKKARILSYPLGAQQRLWSDWGSESSLGAHAILLVLSRCGSVINRIWRRRYGQKAKRTTVSQLGVTMLRQLWIRRNKGIKYKTRIVCLFKAPGSQPYICLSPKLM